MNCIIVDDDKLARIALRKLISEVEGLTLKKELSSATEAFEYLKNEKIDLIFLDVEMPGMSGMDLIRNLEQRPLIILITGKKNYAVEAYELSVADYIMKPVTPKRLAQAVGRSRKLFEVKDQLQDIEPEPAEYIFVRTNSIVTRIKVNDIVYVQGSGEYVNINTSNECSTIHCSLKKIEESLPSGRFYRLHRSYLVAIDRIDSVENNTAYSGKHLLPIGEQYKSELMRKLARA